MAEAIKLGDTPKIKDFYERCQAGMKMTEPPIFCSMCGQQKHEFLDPLQGRLRVLDCECEKKIKMLKEYIAGYRSSYVTTDGKKIQHSDLIDGYATARTGDEFDVVSIGRRVQAMIQEAEINISRRE